MKYELAKKLKDAGFLQKDSHENWCEHEPIAMMCLLGCEGVHKPTLSELISACGDKIEALINQKGGWVAISNIEAYMLKQNFECVPTPEEAVANLWILLNKKGWLK